MAHGIFDLHCGMQDIFGFGMWYIFCLFVLACELLVVAFGT